MAIFTRHESRYGTRRLRAALRQEGHRVGRRARRIGPGPPGPAGFTAQGLHSAHDRFHTQPALCPQPPTRPAQTRQSQPGVGLGHHVFAARQRLLGIPVCLPGHGQQARRGLVRARYDARSTSHHGLAASILFPPADAETSRPFRPRRPVLRQGLPGTTASAPRPAFAKSAWRVLRQRPSWKPVIPPQNGGARSPRAARFCRLSRRPSQRRRVF